MAYRIPLQNGRHRGHVTGWSKLMHIAPSIPLLLRSPAVTAGPWTVEVVTFSCILITLGGVCLVWTAVHPVSGSFLLGAALVAVGACGLGVVCALRWNHEETRAANMAANMAAVRRGVQVCDGTDDEETTMINMEADSSHASSASAVSVSSDFRPGQLRPSDFRSDFHQGELRSSDFRSDLHPSDFQSEHRTNDRRSDMGISDFPSGGHPDDVRSSDFRSRDLQFSAFLPSTTLQPDLVGLGSSLRETGERRESISMRQSPEGAVDNPNIDDFR